MRAFRVDSKAARHHPLRSESAPGAAAFLQPSDRFKSMTQKPSQPFSNAGFVPSPRHSAYSLLKGSIKIQNSASSRNGPPAGAWR